MKTTFTAQYLDELYENSLAFERVLVLPQEKLSPEELLALSYLSATKLNWQIEYMSKHGMIMQVKHDEQVTQRLLIKLENDLAHIQSIATPETNGDKEDTVGIIGVFVHTVNELKAANSADELMQKFQQLNTEFVPENEDIFQPKTRSIKDKVTDFINIFIPRNQYFVTPIILNLNIFIFIVMVASATSCKLK